MAFVLYNVNINGKARRAAFRILINTDTLVHPFLMQFWRSPQPIEHIGALELLMRL